DAASEWTKHANLEFDFGAPTYRSCQPGVFANIKIKFDLHDQYGLYWSYVGTDSLEFEASMNLGNLGEDTLPVRMTDPVAKGIILHEFGHAIGLEHEHQSPSAACDLEIDQQKIAEWAKSVNWSVEQAKSQLARLLSTTLVYTPYDIHSIMFY